jgi:hypothetical protein
MFRVTELSPAFGRDAAVRQHGGWLRDLEEAIFAGEAQARVVTASTIAALMATTYSTATIAGQSEPLAIQKTAPSFSHSRFIEGTVRVLPSAAMQRPNLVAPLAHTTRALWRDRAERRSHGAAE